MLIENFGTGIYDTGTVTKILYFCREYYISKFECILLKEKSFSFYRQIIWFHEQATNLRHDNDIKKLPRGIDKSYIAKYRRILKMIIEQGCYINMVTGEKVDANFKNRITPILNELLFVGEMILTLSESIAEQEMIEDIMDVTFDKKNLYKLSRRHHYEFIFNHIGNKQENDEADYVTDSNGEKDFKSAILENFGFEYDKIMQVVILLMEHHKREFGDCLSFDCNNFIRDIKSYSGGTLKAIKLFLSGLTLTRSIKMPLTEFVKKPHSLNKYLYRPFLVWTINRKKFFVFSIASWHEAVVSLYLNAIPWGKFPKEWEGIKKLKKYVDNKHDEHDKWLDDKVENDLKDAGIRYQRNITKLITKNKSYSLVVKDIGEIDFIILSHILKKVFIADCKHLVGRYDMVNQKNDYDHFTKDGKHKSYNTRMNLKTKWLNENKNILEEHLQLKFNDSSISLTEYQIEGIFLLNTPTFYMYNSDIRIYTHEHLVNVITGKHVDPTFLYTVDSDESLISYSVKYPYFRKPKMIYFNEPDDECEVDKYGYPIK